MTGDTGLPGPHGDRVVTAGAPAVAAEAVVVALHGRGATAQGVLNLLDPVYRHGVAFVAPVAERSRWLPAPATAPLDRQAPYLDSALAVVDHAVADAVEGYGVPRDHVVILGFSQGACVAAEYAAREGGPSPVVLLSGTLLGPEVDRSRYDGSLDGTPVFLGVGAEDTRIQPGRVRATAAVFRALAADVTERVYEGAGHEVTDDEFDHVGRLLDGLLDG